MPRPTAVGVPTRRCRCPQPNANQRSFAPWRPPGINVAATAEELSVTGETVRQDLTILERQGQLPRVYGGAVPVQRLSVEPDVSAHVEYAECSASERAGSCASRPR